MQYCDISNKNKRRYYLHKRLAPSCHAIKATKKTIYIYPDSLITLTRGQRRNMAELQKKFGYSVQQTIPDEN